MTNKEKAEELVNRYLLGKANADERKLIDTWYYSFKTKTTRDQIVRNELEEEIFREISARINQTEKPAPVFSIIPYLKYAAAILLISSFGIGIWAWSRNKVKNEFAITSASAGQYKKIVLTDGSVIMLRPLSTIKYPLRFRSDKRIVELLEGRAFFSIRHESQRPFRVLLAGGLYTHVLGTSFTISAFQRSQRIDISVSSGKVAVGNDQQILGVLVKGDRLLYDKNTHLSEVAKVPQPVKELNFTGSSMLEVIKELQTAYGIKISMQPYVNLEKLKFTGAFTTNQQPEKILWLLSRIHHFKINVSADKKTFKIYKN